MGASAEGEEMMTVLAPSFNWFLSFSMVVKIPVYFTNYLAPAAPHLMLVGFHSWKKAIDGLPVDVKFPIISLACAIELAMVILEYIDHAVKVNEGVINGKNIHLPDIKAALVTRSPVQPYLFTLIFTILSREQGWHCTIRWGCLGNREERVMLHFLNPRCIYEF